MNLSETYSRNLHAAQTVHSHLETAQQEHLAKALTSVSYRLKLGLEGECIHGPNILEWNELRKYDE